MNCVEFDSAKLCIDAGIVLAAKVFCEEVYQRIINLGSHRVYLNATLGAGSGVSICLLLCLTAAQIVSCAALVTPSLFHRLGTAVPSVALGSTTLVEMSLYNGFADRQLCIKSTLLCMCLLMIGLLRGKQRARSASIGTPLHGTSENPTNPCTTDHAPPFRWTAGATHMHFYRTPFTLRAARFAFCRVLSGNVPLMRAGSHLSMEAAVRRACSKCRAGTVLPPLCLVMAVHALVFKCYWRKSGTAFEIERTDFWTTASACSFLLLVAGQDRTASHHARVLAFLNSQYKRAYKKCHGHDPGGGKKSL